MIYLRTQPQNVVENVQLVAEFALSTTFIAVKCLFFC